MIDPYAPQKNYQRRVLAKAKQADAMRASLEQILSKLEGNAKPMAVEVSAIARKGLEG